MPDQHNSLLWWEDWPGGWWESCGCYLSQHQCCFPWQPHRETDEIQAIYTVLTGECHEEKVLVLFGRTSCTFSFVVGRRYENFVKFLHRASNLLMWLNENITYVTVYFIIINIITKCRELDWVSKMTVLEGFSMSSHIIYPAFQMMQACTDCQYWH